MFEIGASLREARLRQGLDFPEFEILPAPTYVRGFLRSYAESLGLDGQPFVDEYNSRFAINEEDAPLRARRVPTPTRRDRETRESRLVVVALLAITVVAALVIAAWKFGGPNSESVPGLQSTPATAQKAEGKRRVSLVVRAVGGSSWMEVRSGASGTKLLYSGTLEQGQQQSFEGANLQLALAKPGNVSVRLNGATVDLPVGTTFVVTSKRIVRASS
jgi:hypothetical protein